MTALATDPAEPHIARPPGGAREGVTAERGLEVCPLLRSRDASWSSVFASRDLRCWAVDPAAQPTIAKQRQLCVTAMHVECPTYRAASAPDPALPADDGDASLLWAAAAPTPIALESPRGRPAVGVSSPRAGSQALLVALMVVAFVVLAIARTAPLGGGNGGTAGSSLAPSPSAASSALVVASPTDAPTPLATPQATPSVSPSGSARPSPTPSPSASHRTYKVRSGDTLAIIAGKFHTTVKAIVAANGIVDPRTIHPGQVLVIP